MVAARDTAQHIRNVVQSGLDFLATYVWQESRNMTAQTEASKVKRAQPASMPYTKFQLA
jgi:hypothetical protein